MGLVTSVPVYYSRKTIAWIPATWKTLRKKIRPLSSPWVEEPKKGRRKKEAKENMRWNKNDETFNVVSLFTSSFLVLKTLFADL